MFTLPTQCQIADLRNEIFEKDKNCTRRDVIRNEHISEEVGIYKVNDKKLETEGNWKHLTRINSKRVPQG